MAKPSTDQRVGPQSWRVDGRSRVAIELYREPAATGAWPRRRIASFVVRALGLLVPLAAGCVAAIIANHVLPDAHHIVTVIPRTLVVVAASMTTIAALDRSVRRYLPLATLLQLSLVFPDAAPSRVRIALQSSNRRRVRRLVADATENGLADDPAVAAEQVMLLVAALGDHDRYTRGHSERVRVYADLIGREMRLTKEERQKLQWGALLHDLGKLHLAASIVDKKGPLDANEWILVRRHPEQGRRLLRPLVPFLGEWAEAVWNHHERWDGTGYPRGVGAERIGRAAAIVAVADSFEAMTSAHGYKKAVTVAEARAEVGASAETQFSPEVVRAFLSISLGRLRIAMGPFAALAHVPFIQRATALPGLVGTSFNNGVAVALSSAGPALTAGALSLGAMVGTGVIDGAAPAEPQDAVFCRGTSDDRARSLDLDEVNGNLAVAGVIAATNPPATTTTVAAAEETPPTTASATGDGCAETAATEPTGDRCRRAAADDGAHHTVAPTTAPPDQKPTDHDPTADDHANDDDDDATDHHDRGDALGPQRLDVAQSIGAHRARQRQPEGGHLVLHLQHVDEADHEGRVLQQRDGHRCPGSNGSRCAVRLRGHCGFGQRQPDHVCGSGIEGHHRQGLLHGRNTDVEDGHVQRRPVTENARPLARQLAEPTVEQRRGCPVDLDRFTDRVGDLVSTVPDRSVGPATLARSIRPIAAATHRCGAVRERAE